MKKYNQQNYNDKDKHEDKDKGKWGEVFCSIKGTGFAILAMFPWVCLTEVFWPKFLDMFTFQNFFAPQYIDLLNIQEIATYIFYKKFSVWWRG